MFRRLRRSDIAPLCLGVVGLTAASVAVPVARPAAALANIVVSTTVDDYAINGNCTLREAIASANLNQAIDACTAGTNGTDTISLQAATYVLGIEGRDESGDLTGDLDIAENANIAGAGAIIDAGGVDRVLEVLLGAFVTISGVTIRGDTLCRTSRNHRPTASTWAPGSTTPVISRCRTRPSRPTSATWERRARLKALESAMAVPAS